MPRLRSIFCMASRLALIFSSSFPSLANTALDDPLPRQADKPLEAITDVDTFYGSVEVEPGVRLRTLISRPSSIDKPMHPSTIYAMGYPAARWSSVLAQVAC